MRHHKNIVWGMFLVVLGVLLLLERVGGVHWPVGSLWPLVFLALAANSAIERQVGGTVMFLLLGLIFFSVTLGWFGLSYHSAWPLMMVAAGLGMVIRAVGSRRGDRESSEVTHE
ncbi:MAG: LiaF transmembrane domain-containing protein [Candidatus Eiseniibacteriota bacterium]